MQGYLQPPQYYWLSSPGRCSVFGSADYAYLNFPQMWVKGKRNLVLPAAQMYEIRSSEKRTKAPGRIAIIRTDEIRWSGICFYATKFVGKRRAESSAGLYHYKKDHTREGYKNFRTHWMAVRCCKGLSGIKIILNIHFICSLAYNVGKIHGKRSDRIKYGWHWTR